MAYLPPGRSPKSGLLSQPPEMPKLTPTVPKFTLQKYKPVTGDRVNVRSTEDVLNDIPASVSKYIQQARQLGPKTPKLIPMGDTSTVPKFTSQEYKPVTAGPVNVRSTDLPPGRSPESDLLSQPPETPKFTPMGNTSTVSKFTPQEYKPVTGDQVNVRSTEDVLNDITASDSKYIQQARQLGMETGAARGLLNSSMSAGAAERAAIESALPIALQDAGYTQDLGRTRAQEEASSRLSYQDYTQSGNLIEQKGEIDFALKDKEIEALVASAERDHQYAMELQATGASQQAIENALARADDSRLKLTLAEMERDSKLSAINAQGKIDAGRDQVKIDADKANLDTEIRFKMWAEESQQAGATLRANTELAAKERINNANITSAERTAAMNAIADAGLQYSIDVRDILRDPNLDEAAKRAGYANATTTYEKSIAHTMALLGGGTSKPVDTTQGFTPTQSKVNARYNAIFGRDGDFEGIKYWADQIEDPNNPVTLQNLDSYLEPFKFTPTESKVNDRYRAVFGRDGDVEGIKYWAGQIEDPNNPVTLQNLDSYLEPFKEKERGLLTGNDDVPDNSNGLLTGKEIDPSETPEEKEERIYQEKAKDWDPVFQPGGKYELYGRYAAWRGILRPSKVSAQSWMVAQQNPRDGIGK